MTATHDAMTRTTARWARWARDAHRSLLWVGTVAALLAGMDVEPALARVRHAAVNWVVPDSFDGLYINVETLATSSTEPETEWHLNPYSLSPEYFAWFSASGPAMLRHPGHTDGSAGNLAPGVPVGPEGSYGSGVLTFGSAPGDWHLNALNRFGFRFIAADGLTHYGWGTFSFGATLNGSDRRITEIAWETSADVPVFVGDTVGVTLYSPCASSNPTIEVGGNDLEVSSLLVPDLVVACDTVHRANYYRFVAPESRLYEFSTCSGEVPSTLLVTDGCTPGARVVACGAPCGPAGSRVVFSATAGSAYYIVLGASLAGTELPSHCPVQCTSGLLAVGDGDGRDALSVAFAAPSPNPSHGRTTLAWTLANAGAVRLELYSVDGRRVRTLAAGVHGAGAHRLEWDGRDDAGRVLRSGVYWARLTTPAGEHRRALTLVRE